MESTPVSVLFIAPSGNLMTNIDEAVNGMNERLGLSEADPHEGDRVPRNLPSGIEGSS